MMKMVMTSVCARRERRGILAAALLAVVALTGGTATAADQGAEYFVKGIYANYTGQGMQAMGVPLDSEAVVNRYFEPSLAQMIIKDSENAGGEVGALDGDPFVDAQDWDIQAFDIKVEDTGPGKARATVRFKNYGDDKTVTLSLVRIGNQWKISDIDWGPDGTLRALFKPH